MLGYFLFPVGGLKPAWLAGTWTVSSRRVPKGLGLVLHVDTKEEPQQLGIFRAPTMLR